jgi:hypothetical protein
MAKMSGFNSLFELRRDYKELAAVFYLGYLISNLVSLSYLGAFDFYEFATNKPDENITS